MKIYNLTVTHKWVGLRLVIYIAKNGKKSRLFTVKFGQFQNRRQLMLVKFHEYKELVAELPKETALTLGVTLYKYIIKKRIETINFDYNFKITPEKRIWNL